MDNLLTLDVLKVIKSESVTVDDETIQGAYNLVFNERRLKAEIQLINGRDDFNTQIKNSLLNAERITDFTKNGNHEDVSSIVFDKNWVADNLSNDIMWGSAATTEERGQTYSPDFLETGTFIPKSKLMVQNIYGALVSLTRKLGSNDTSSSGEYEFSSGPVYTSFKKNIAQFPNENLIPYKLKKPSHNVRFKTDKPKYTFMNGFYNIVNFLMRGLEIDNGTQVAASSFRDKFSTYGGLMESYLDSLLAGLGSGFTDFAIENWSSNELKTILPIPSISALSDEDDDFKDLGILFYGAKYRTLKTGTNHVCYMSITWKLLDLYLRSLSEQAEIDEEEIIMFANNAGGQKCYYHLFAPNNNWELRVAAFISSILKYSWNVSEISRFVANFYTRTYLLHNQNYSNSCLWHQNLHAVRGTTLFNYQAQCTGGAWNGHVFRSDYNHAIGIMKQIKYIRCLKNIVYAGNPENNVYFGSVQVKSESETSESGIKNIFVPHATNPYPEDSIFQPVRREFYIANWPIPAKMYCDNINFNELSVNKIRDFALAACMFPDTNWMYFDDIEIKEFGCDYLNPSETYFDPIPIFDIETQQAYDGTYIYKDFFNKFFTSKPLKLLSLEANLTNNGSIIYRGFIDYSTIQYDHKSISFTATDIIGVLAESIAAINGCICWAGYSKSLLDYKALPYCGTTLHGFMNFLLTGGVFNVFQNSIIPTFNQNKILENIDSSTAFSIAIQCLMKMVKCNYDDNSIEFVDIDNNSVAIDIADSNILSMSRSVVDNYLEKYDPSPLKALAGFDKVMQDISLFYNSLFRNKNETIKIEVLARETNINILDKICVDFSNYIVMSKEINIKKKTMTLMGVKV